MKKNTAKLIKDDFRDFIDLLNKHRIDYCITGAYAVSFHSEPRSTRDIDFYIAPTQTNSIKTAAVIKEFAGADIDCGYFNTNETVILRIGVEPNQIELSNGLTGLRKEEILRHRVKGKYSGITAYYLGLNEIIKNKALVKNMVYRGRKRGSDSADYETLKLVKHKLLRKKFRK